MRGHDSFDETRALLAARGFVAGEVRTSGEEDFGSWSIVVSGDPRFRIVWDGKDDWVIVQGELSERPELGQSDWVDLWIGKRPEDLTPAATINALERLRAFVLNAQTIA